MEERPDTLFDRIGGLPAVTALVDDFYARVLADPQLAPFFERVPMDKLRHMQVELFSAALGGPGRYTGRSLAHAHQHLHTTLADFQRFVQHLFDTLARYHLSDEECYEVIGRLNLYTNDIVSAGTGVVG